MGKRGGGLSHLKALQELCSRQEKRGADAFSVNAVKRMIMDSVVSKRVRINADLHLC